MEKQILSSPFISTFASHPAPTMHRCQQKASHPHGRARIMRSISTASSHSFSFTLGKKKSFCAFQCSVFLLFKRVKSSWTNDPGDQPEHPSLSKATPWVAAAGSSICSSAISPLLSSLPCSQFKYLKGITFPTSSVQSAFYFASCLSPECHISHWHVSP